MNRKKFGISMLLALMLALLVAACGGGGSSSSSSATSYSMFTTGQSATVAIGALDLNTAGTGAATASGVGCPWGAPVFASGNLYVPDSCNNRIMVFAGIPASNAAAASFVLGQPNFVTTAISTTASSVSGPQGGTVYNGKYAVSDWNNNRIAIYNTLPASGPGNIDVVVGQANKLTNAPACTQNGINLAESVYMGGGKLVVADTRNNRVMIWNTIPTTDGANADLVLGQTGFTNCVASSVVSASTLSIPTAVWTDGTKLVVADGNNSRVLIWNTFPTSNNQPADVVLGQANFFTSAVQPTSASSLNNPWDGVFSDGTQLFVSDSGNNRTLIWNSFPTRNGQAADVVLGQPNFVSSGVATTASGVLNTFGVYLYGKQLFVTDTGNNRILIYQGK